MITAEQIRKLARQQKIGSAVVEKDYALTWLLKGFFIRSSRLKETFVLKGGTAIRKAYFPGSWRFSEDLDFTVIGDKKGAGEIRKAIQLILDKLLKESRITYSIYSFHANEGAVISYVQFRGPLDHPNRIKLDISLSEKMALKAESRTIKSEFPDMQDFKILTYSLKEIVAEKIRSIMQRGYSRDYYDVWRLMKENTPDKSELRNLLIQKCEMKGIEYQPALLFENERIEEARSYWTTSLAYLTKELPDFEKVILELKTMLNFLQS